MLNKLSTLSTFTRINLVLLAVLLPLLAINSYSNITSNQVVRNEILRSSETYMALLTNQVDTTADQMSAFALNLNRDPSITALEMKEAIREPYDRLTIFAGIREKLSLNSSSLPWNNQISIFIPAMKQVVSSTGNVIYDEEFLNINLTQSWKYMPISSKYGQPYFVRHLVEPRYNAATPVSSYRVITEALFPAYNLVKMLDQFKNTGNVHDPFLFKPDMEPILNNSSHTSLVKQLQQIIQQKPLGAYGNDTVELDGGKYLITYKLSNTLDWYLVDYVPLQEALAPINRSSQLFIGSVIILVLLGLIFSYFIYRNVQIPIKKLVASARAISRGDFSVQVSYSAKNEFHFLISQFNSMSSKIKELIELIYESKIRLQQATLKQLQSQVDPHFLYNSLNFIMYSAKKGDEDAVVSMSLHLGAYYRSATRLEKALTTLDEELKLIYNYLEIHKLRMHEMTYEIELHKDMAQLELPRLILQPLVENAIIHGISKCERPGYIQIRTDRTETHYLVSVEDNGEGMPTHEQQDLMEQILHPGEEHDLCGLWNVAQRLILHFGENAGLGMETSSYGGLKVWLYWPVPQAGEENIHVPALDRR